MQCYPDIGNYSHLLCFASIWVINTKAGHLRVISPRQRKWRHHIAIGPRGSRAEHVGIWEKFHRHRQEFTGALCLLVYQNNYLPFKIIRVIRTDYHGLGKLKRAWIPFTTEENFASSIFRGNNRLLIRSPAGSLGYCLLLVVFAYLEEGLWD
jgi:hypothetical protein